MTGSLSDRPALLELLLDLARRAGDLVMEVYATDFGVEDKGGNDPVTVADKRANALICGELSRAFPSVPVVAEESPPSSYVGFGEARSAFFVDPLDGTREFVAKNGEFAVMIGLAEEGRAVAGVVHAPARGLTWLGARGLGAFVIDASGRRSPIAPAPLTRLSEARLVVSRSRRSERLEKMLARSPVREVVPLGSAGLKVTAVASGEAGAYVQLGRAGSLWDSCAPEAIAMAAGARVSDQQGLPIDYRTTTVELTSGLVTAPVGIHDELLAAIAAG